MIDFKNKNFVKKASEDEMVHLMHSHTYGNMEEVLSVDTCGCGYCCKIFPTYEIAESDILSNGRDETAICPYCGVDCVIPSSKKGEYILNSTWLNKVCDRYF